jgi:hypothetical protein
LVERDIPPCDLSTVALDGSTIGALGTVCRRVACVGAAYSRQNRVDRRASCVAWATGVSRQEHLHYLLPRKLVELVVYSHVVVLPRPALLSERCGNLDESRTSAVADAALLVRGAGS